MERERILKSIAETRQFMDSVIMEIGQEYARYFATNDENLKTAINANVEVLQQLEIRLKDLRRELISLN